MEKKKRARFSQDDDSNCMEDKISHLPHHIAQHILSFLPQNNAVRTCVLSKSWRYLWFARPNLEFRQICFNGDKQTFLSVLDATLKRYRDQKLSIRNFVMEMSDNVDSESVSLLENLIPIVIANKGVMTFDLSFSSQETACFDLPSIVFKANSLQELYLEKCNLSRINSSDEIVMCKRLQTLSLKRVYVEEEALEKIMSSCPLIDYLLIDRCEGLRNINVNKCNHNLKDFGFRHHKSYANDHRDSCSIEINVPTLETIRIEGCSDLFPHHNYFPNLRALYLGYVELSRSTSFVSFSSNYLPGLLCLTLDSCYGFQEFHLSNHSIKRLIFKNLKKSVRASIDAPNIVRFEYSGDFCPSDITFTMTYNEWKSDIRLCYDVGHGLINGDSASKSWFLNLSKMLKAVSPSEISLEIYQRRRRNRHVSVIYLFSYKPVVVEHLKLSFGGHTLPSFSGFSNCLFSTCRPRNIGMCLTYSKSRTKWELEEQSVTEFFCKILVSEIGSMPFYSWRRDLKEIIVKVFDENEQKWHHVDGRRFAMNAAAVLPVNQHRQNIRFRLTWKTEIESDPLYSSDYLLHL